MRAFAGQEDGSPAARDTARGEVIWRWIALAFAAYWTLFIVGAYTGKQELNDVGAVFILAAVAWASLERLWVKVDAVAIVCVIAALAPLAMAFVSHSERYPAAIVKFESLYLVMALSRLLRLPAVSQSKMRYLLALQVLIVLALSLITDRGGVWDGGTRHSGLFANPNNLALIPFLLLFFIDRDRDPFPVRVMAHLIVIGVLAWTGTSGAVMAYAIGLTFHFKNAIPGRWRVPVYALALCCILSVVGLIAFNEEGVLPDTRFTKQVAVMRAELSKVLAGGEVAYYEQEKVLGPGAASGIWRLVHWRRTVAAYLDGNAAQLIAGFGIGSSPVLMGKLPHNEYIRLLFEQGILGLTLFVFAWSRTIATAPREVRYIGLILAIYSFSENNLDNFPFMALFILCLSAVERLPAGGEATPAGAPLKYAVAS